MDRYEFRNMIQNPDPDARVKTRWWWYGCKVKEDDILFQLDRMQEAGIGGVEIQITYPLQAGDDNIDYFSPDFFRILKFTSEALKERNMVMDLTLGSSWPFGGPFVPFVKSAVSVIPLELTVEGPSVFSYDFTNRISGEIIGCVMGEMEGSEMLAGTVTDLEEHLKEKLLYNWPWGTRLEEIEIPEGVWKIVVFVASQFREHVLMPTRGAQGYVIDHNDREAVRFFLEHAGTPIVERLGRGAIRNFFCDSLEVFGHNWSIHLFREFEKRRGYSLKPYIYALWGRMQGLTDKIRYDFHKTLSEMTVEGFFAGMTSWCHEMGSASRIQAHGTWGDVLLAYGNADVPEGETFSAWDKFSVNTVHRRLASSAGHLYGKPVISNESFTWLRFPRFTETLEQIKIAADSILTDGINEIVNHGYSYSPKEGEPLYFYASSTISHTNPWWPYYHSIARYLNRVCHFLRLGKICAPVCIYLPQSDIWAENPLGDVHMCMKLEEKIETSCVDMLAHHGFWFDYINDEALCRWRDYSYDTLIILETDRMPEETARQVEAFAEAGGLVICAGKMPSMDCGLYGNKDIAGMFSRMVKTGKVILTDDKKESLLNCLLEHRTPDLCVDTGLGDIGYVHRTDGDTDIYFVSNMSRNLHETVLKIASGRRNAQVMILDPMSGEELICGPADPFREADLLKIPVRFLPGQSFLVLLVPEDHRKDDANPADTGQISLLSKKRGSFFGTGSYYGRTREQLLDLSDDWILEVPEKGLVLEQKNLEGFEKNDALRYFSGEVIYRKRFTIPEEEFGRLQKQEKATVYLRAECVETAAAVFLNGKPVTEWIQRPYLAELTGALKEGENELCIRVSNLLINRFLDPGRKLWEYPDQILDQWPYFPQQLNKERGKRLDAWREREMVKEPFPSGIIGKVCLDMVYDF